MSEKIPICRYDSCWNGVGLQGIVQSCDCSLAEASDIDSMLRIYNSFCIFLEPILLFLFTLGSYELRGFFKLLQVVDLPFGSCEPLCGFYVEPGVYCGLSEGEEPCGSLEKDYFCVEMQRRLQMCEEGKVGIGLICDSVEPDEGFVGFGVGDSDGVVMGVSEDLGYFETSHVAIIIVIFIQNFQKNKRYRNLARHKKHKCSECEVYSSHMVSCAQEGCNKKYHIICANKSSQAHGWLMFTRQREQNRVMQMFTTMLFFARLYLETIFGRPTRDIRINITRVYQQIDFLPRTQQEEALNSF